MRTPDEIAEELDAEPPSAEEVYALCQDAMAGHEAMDTLEALVFALGDAGYKVVNTTTDDDDTTRLEIWPVADGEARSPYEGGHGPRV